MPEAARVIGRWMFPNFQSLEKMRAEISNRWKKPGTKSWGLSPRITLASPWRGEGRGEGAFLTSDF